MQTFYLEPLDAHTNEAFANYPLDESLRTEIRVKGKSEPVPVWEANEDALEYFKKSLSHSNLTFAVYEKQKTGGVKFVRRYDRSLALV